MRTKKKKIQDLSKAELKAEKDKVDKSLAKVHAHVTGEAVEEEIYQQPIYNIFNFFIGGPNRAKIRNKAYGKPGGGTPPPY